MGIPKISNRSGGFTLIELLVVIAVIAVIAAILFPVFVRAKAAALRTTCISNARQIGMGLQEYSSDYDGCIMQVTDNDAGDPASVGVDPDPADFQTWYDWVQPYTHSYTIQRCPAFYGQYPIPDPSVANRFVHSTFAISQHVVSGVVKGDLEAVPDSSSTMLVAETRSGYTYFADFATNVTAADMLMQNGEMHFVQYHNGLTDDFGDPALSARVTVVAVDGHVQSVAMDNTNGSGVTQDAAGLLHDPVGGYDGLYVTGPDGSLTLP